MVERQWRRPSAARTIARHTTSRRSATGAAFRALMCDLTGLTSAPSDGLCEQVSARADQLVGSGLHPLPDVPRERGFVRQNVDNPRIEASFEKPHELRPDAVSGDADVAVGFVFDKRHLPRVEIRAQLTAAAGEERPDDRPVLGASPPARAGRHRA